jgi:transposase-like protein
MAHKKYSANEKMAVVMSMLKSQKPVTQICKEYGISDAMAYRWRDQLADQHGHD